MTDILASPKALLALTLLIASVAMAVCFFLFPRRQMMTIAGLKSEINMAKPRPFHEWHEDHGDVIWWLWPIEQAPWVGSPLCIGRTVSFDMTVQIGIDVYEVQPQKVGDTGGWPWADADEETEARLFWTPLPDGNAIDEAIRDHIRGGPDPLKERAVPSRDELGATAIDMVIASLSPAQIQLLKDMRPNGDGWTYPVKVRGDGLQSCMALVKRSIVSGDNPQPFQNRGRGFIRLTPFGEGLRNIIVGGRPMGLALEKLPDWPAGMGRDLALAYTGVSTEQMREWERAGRVRFRPRGPRGQMLALRIDLDAALADLFGSESKGGIEL